MEMPNPANRNLWIIAALVGVTAALLVWFLNSGAGAPGSDVAKVSVEAPPGAGDAIAGRTDSDVAGAAPGTLAPPAGTATSGSN